MASVALMLHHGLPTDFTTPLLRLSTLIWLRWMAVFGQLAAVMLVTYGLHFSLPVSEAAMIIGLSAVLNIVLSLLAQPSHRLKVSHAGLLLAFDILQLGGLLYLTGGMANPFVYLFLAPVMVSATMLPPRVTLVLGLLVAGLSTLIAYHHLPLPWHDALPPELPVLYLVGQWVALNLTSAFMSVYGWRIAEEGRQLSTALAATELALAGERHLSDLDGLATATAHELGTPLGTITITAKELLREVGTEGPIAEDVALIRQQAERCRAILRRLSSLGAEGPDHIGTLSLSSLIEEAIDPHRDFGITLEVTISGEGAEPVGLRRAALQHALGNLIENAVDFASGTVCVVGTWDALRVTITITDDGPGFAPDVLPHIGEPYVSTRPRQGEKRDTIHPGAGLNGGGLGLGLFIAKTLLERSGALLRFRNRTDRSGAEIHIQWPRTSYEKRQLEY